VLGILYTLTNSIYMLVGIQMLHGIGAGILVVADLTCGTGRFNLTLGAIATAIGIGVALSKPSPKRSFTTSAIGPDSSSWPPSRRRRC